MPSRHLTRYIEGWTPLFSREWRLHKFAYQIGVGGLVLSDLEKRLVNEVLDSNCLTYGPKTKLFERAFSGRHGCRFGNCSRASDVVLLS